MESSTSYVWEKGKKFKLKHWIVNIGVYDVFCVKIFVYIFDYTEKFAMWYIEFVNKYVNMNQHFSKNLKDLEPMENIAK